MFSQIKHIKENKAIIKFKEKDGRKYSSTRKNML